MLCTACILARTYIYTLYDTVWCELIDTYEYMLAITTFHRNVTFYASMTKGQLKTLYCELVLFSSAKIMGLNALMTKHRGSGDSSREPLTIPDDLSTVVALSLGSTVPRYFVTAWVSQHR